jgi:hypothetical protein
VSRLNSKANNLDPMLHAARVAFNAAPNHTSMQLVLHAVRFAVNSKANNLDPMLHASRVAFNAAP